LVERWAQQFGMETAAQICAFDQVPPVTSIRLRDPGAENDLPKEGIELEPGALLANARRVVAGDVTKTKPYADGRIAIQDEASQLVAALVGKGNRILDCCAAPGGKTWSIADRNPSAAIVAVECYERRAQLLRKRVKANNVQVITCDVCKLPVADLFDRVLADVPCSGTGTLARNPEIKWRLREEDLSELHARQVEILRAAARHLSPGGSLIYSTCSLEREENEAVVDEVLAADSALCPGDVKSELDRMRQADEMSASSVDSVSRGSCLRTIPGIQPTDGFFAAILRRA
jgi:16S rRNA (cytosine967-C5)-methyltransferase